MHFEVEEKLGSYAPNYQAPVTGLDCRLRSSLEEGKRKLSNSHGHFSAEIKMKRDQEQCVERMCKQCLQTLALLQNEKITQGVKEFQLMKQCQKIILFLLSFWSPGKRAIIRVAPSGLASPCLKHPSIFRYFSHICSHHYAQGRQLQTASVLGSGPRFTVLRNSKHDVQNYQERN